MAPKTDARKKLEQIRRNKNKNKSTKVRDLRQLISKKKKTTPGNDRSANKTASGRITKTRTSGSRGDLRDTGRKLSVRKHESLTRSTRTSNRSAQQGSSRSTSSANMKATRTFINGRQQTKSTQRQQIQYYMPPHMQQPQPTYIIAPTAATPQSNLAMDNVPEAQRASILITNLLPSISQNDIITLFESTGKLADIVMINSTTALVTYERASDAVAAVKTYNNRELDGQVMFVNIMPTSHAPTSNVRSRVGHSRGIGRNSGAMDVLYGRRI